MLCWHRTSKMATDLIVAASPPHRWKQGPSLPGSRRFTGGSTAPRRTPVAAGHLAAGSMAPRRWKQVASPVEVGRLAAGSRAPRRWKQGTSPWEARRLARGSRAPRRGKHGASPVEAGRLATGSVARIHPKSHVSGVGYVRIRGYVRIPQDTYPVRIGRFSD
jgi:hypothetical protein